MVDLGGVWKEVDWQKGVWPIVAFNIFHDDKNKVGEMGGSCAEDMTIFEYQRSMLLC